MLEPDLPYAGFSTFWELVMTKFMPTQFKFRLMFMLSLLLGSGWLGGVFASPHALQGGPSLATVPRQPCHRPLPYESDLCLVTMVRQVVVAQPKPLPPQTMLN